MLQRLTLYITLGLVLDAAGLAYNQSLFWCVLGLFIALEWLTRLELIEQLNNELQALRRGHNKDSNDNNN